MSKKNRWIGLVVALLGGWLAAPGFAVEPGAVVEALGPSTGEGRVEVEVGDLLTHWRRGSAHGAIASPFDVEQALFAELPQGTLTVSGQRGGRLFEGQVEVGGPGLELRPNWDSSELDQYLAGRALVDAGISNAGAEPWQALAEHLVLEGQAGAAAWLWRQLGRAWAEQLDQHGDKAQTALERALELLRGGLPDPPPTGAPAHLELELARLLARRGDSDTAEQRYRDLLERQGGESAESLDAAQTSILLASLIRGRNQIDEAEALYQRALDIRQRLQPDSLPVAEALNGLAVVAVDRGDFERGKAFHRRALGLRERLAPWSRDAFISHNNIGVLAFQQGNYTLADDHFVRALEIQERLDPESLGVAAIVGNLATVATRQGDLARAEALFRQALTLRQRLAPGSVGVARALGNLGVVAKERGDLAGAEALQRQALKIKQRLDPEGSTVASNLINLGNILELRGDLDAAEEHLRRAIDIESRLAPDGLRQATALLALANLEVGRGAWAQASRLLQRVIRIAEEKAPEGYEHAVALHNLAEVVVEEGDLARAEALFLETLRVKQSGAPQGSASSLRTLLRLAEMTLDRGDLPLAATRFEEAAALAEEIAPGSLEASEANAGLARVRQADGQPAEALVFWRRSIEALEEQSRRLGGSADLRSRFAGRYGGLYRRTLDQQLAAEQPTAAFDTLERYRARVFVSLLAERDLVFAEDLPDDLETRRRRLDAEYDRLFERLANHRVEPERRAETRQDLQRIRHRQDEVAREVRAVNPRLASLTDPEPLDLAAVRTMLDPGTLLLSYSVGEERTVLFAVGPGDDDLVVRRLEIGATELARRAERLRKSIETLAEKSVVTAELEDLGNLLLAPIEAAIAGADRLLVLPDGPLHQLPLGALGLGGEPLIARRPVTLAASATVFAELTETPKSGAPVRLLAVGDPTTAPEAGPGLPPLPNTRVEVLRLAELFGEGSQILLGAEATEARLKAMASQASVLHLAGHGLVDPHHPLDSAIALASPSPSSEASGQTAGERQENGFLQAWEIFEQLRLDADLVTLSACRGGLGPSRGGEGLMGLVRAFQFAGARSVLASLWSVNDRRTVLLMERFYGHLVAGVSKDKALRRAQLDLLRGPIEVEADAGAAETVDATHPLYWAGFQLFGDWR